MSETATTSAPITLPSFKIVTEDLPIPTATVVREKRENPYAPFAATLSKETAKAILLPKDIDAKTLNAVKNRIRYAVGEKVSVRFNDKERQPKTGEVVLMAWLTDRITRDRSKNGDAPAAPAAPAETAETVDAPAADAA